MRIVWRVSTWWCSTTKPFAISNFVNLVFSINYYWCWGGFGEKSLKGKLMVEYRQTHCDITLSVSYYWCWSGFGKKCLKGKLLVGQGRIIVILVVWSPFLNKGAPIVLGFYSFFFYLPFIFAFYYYHYYYYYYYYRYNSLLNL